MTPERAQRTQRQAWILGMSAAAVLVVAAIFDAERFFQAYLFAYLFGLALALGTLVIGMIAQVTGGRWGVVVRRPAAAAGAMLPVLALLFLPLLFGLHQLYPWTSGRGAPQHLLEHKELYLNQWFFIARSVAYFAIWIWLGLGFGARLRDAEERGAARDWQRLRRLSAAGLLLYALTGTLAAIDWLMSLLPVWYSTVFAAQVLAVQMLAASAVVVLSAGLARAPVAANQRTQDYHDLGNLMLVFTLLWAYLAYSDFLTVWIADLPHETEWYRQRGLEPWRALGISVWVLQFGLPFAALLFRAVKRHPGRMSGLAVLVLVGSLLNFHWLIMPSLRTAAEPLSWVDWAAALALGSIWLALYLSRLERFERGRQAIVGGHAHAGH